MRVSTIVVLFCFLQLVIGSNHLKPCPTGSGAAALRNDKQRYRVVVKVVIVPINATELDMIEEKGGGQDGAENRQGVESVLGAIGALTSALSIANTALDTVLKTSDTATALIKGGTNNVNALGEFIKAGIELAKVFGLGKHRNVLLFENRCSVCGEVEVSCTSWRSGYKGFFDLEEVGDLAVLKFNTYLPQFLTFITWKCKFRRSNGQKTVEQDFFGGQAPKEDFNYFQIRKKGVYRFDKEFNAIDISQSIARWQ